MKTGGLISAATQTKRRLLSSTSGSMTIPGLVFFTMLMAVGGLTIDIQRVYGVHGQMQAFVDDVALAAAAELDGQSTALTRGFRAAVGDGVGPLVTGPANSARFATNTTLTVRKVTFLRAIGADPGPLAPTPAVGDDVLCTWDNGTWTPSSCSTTAALAQDARFVEIVAAPRTVSYIVLPIANVFGQVLGAGQLQANLQLRATAGFRRAICNNVPLMVCNPAEATQGEGADFDPAEFLGHQFMVKLNDGWDPPNFGVIDNYPGSGAANLAEALGKVSPSTTCTEDEIVLDTGTITGPIDQGMNTRFDMYQGSFKSSSTSSNYAPAPNVVKGVVGCGNNPPQSTNSIPLPRDNCFMAAAPGKMGSCAAYMGGDPRFGDGQWARLQYWEANHPGITPPTGYIDGSHPNGGWSRYQTYRYEIEHPEMVNIPMDEQGAPACSNQTPDTHRDRDRRLLYIAVVNCVENEDVIGPNANVPVKAYAKVFLTEPVGNTPWDDETRTINGVTLTWPDITNKDIAVEVVDVVKPNDESGHLHVYPVLYR
jgi:hypothetical protein